MSTENDIIRMVERLRRAQIPIDNLCYEVDEPDWQDFMRSLENASMYPSSYFGYLEECHYMGLHIRKRTAERRSE